MGVVLGVRQLASLSMQGRRLPCNCVASGGWIILDILGRYPGNERCETDAVTDRQRRMMMERDGDEIARR